MKLPLNTVLKLYDQPDHYVPNVADGFIPKWQALSSQQSNPASELACHVPRYDARYVGVVIESGFVIGVVMQNPALPGVVHGSAPSVAESAAEAPEAATPEAPEPLKAAAQAAIDKVFANAAKPLRTVAEVGAVDILSMRELQEALKAKGLSAKGTKVELQNALREAE